MRRRLPSGHRRGEVVTPSLVEDDAPGPDDLVGDKVVDKPRGRVEGVADEDALPGFGGELAALR
jgi:hypothetical protein